MSPPTTSRLWRPGLVDDIKAVAVASAPWLPGVHVATRTERKRRSAILRHDPGLRPPWIPALLVPDKHPTTEDVAIADRLLRAHQAAVADDTNRSDRPDLWTAIIGQQTRFASLLAARDKHQLAAYLCNVSRHDASIGITQGNLEYDRIRRDSAYRRFLALMAKDKLVSLAEAVGFLPVENPEQEPCGANLHYQLDPLVMGISRHLDCYVYPPDIDGGLFKIVTSHGLFGERDANAIYTASLLQKLAKGRPTSVCEIGAGSGRVAYWASRLGIASHTLVDLPHVNVVQAYYLLKTLPPAYVRLYGEDATGDQQITVWPHHAIGELPDEHFDIVLNQDSMPEMNRATVDEYIAWIRRVLEGSFLSINHESKPSYGGQRHVSVPEAMEDAGGFTLVERWPYWLRKGYTVERYQLG